MSHYFSYPVLDSFHSMANFASNTGGNTPGIHCHPASSVLSPKMSLLDLKYVSNLNDIPIPRWVSEPLRNELC